jgi:hypothetical protein
MKRINIREIRNGVKSKVTRALMRMNLLLLVLFLLPCLSYSQNIVINVTGKVLVNGQPVKKGDNLTQLATPKRIIISYKVQ